jgi:HK97 gp10 family phage protein
MSYQHIQVQGLRELERRLTELGPKIARKIGNKATAKGAAVIRDEARARARFTRGYSTGYIKDNIIQFRPTRRRRELENEIHIGVRLRGSRKKRLAQRTVSRMRRGRKVNAYPGYYWFMLEFGTRNMAAQPFLRPAFESRAGAALAKTIETLRANLDKAAAP